MVCADIQACREKDSIGSIWCRWLARPVIGSPRPVTVAVRMTNPRQVEQLPLSVFHFSDYSFQRNASRAART